MGTNKTISLLFPGKVASNTSTLGPGVGDDLTRGRVQSVPRTPPFVPSYPLSGSIHVRPFETPGFWCLWYTQEWETLGLRLSRNNKSIYESTSEPTGIGWGVHSGVEGLRVDQTTHFFRVPTSQQPD